MKKEEENSRKRQEKRIHYNVISRQNLEEFLWYFLIIEDRNEIEKIRQRIRAELNPAEDDGMFKEGIIGNSHGLKYRLFNLQSPRSEIDFSQIYNGRIIRDQRLHSEGSNINLLGVLEQEEIILCVPRKNETPEEYFYRDYTTYPDYTH